MGNMREEILKIAKPILFNTEMVRAIQDGRKTVTRRVCHIKINGNTAVNHNNCYMAEYPERNMDGLCAIFFNKEHHYRGCAKPPYKAGDVLYVRETWRRFSGMLYGWENGTYIPLDDFDGYQYKSDEQCFCVKGINPFCGAFEDQNDNICFEDKWHPSIHMPKEAARIFLRVTDVRVERLQDMTLDDFLSEGIVLRPEAFNDPNNAYHQAKEQYEALWNSTCKKSDLDKYGWAANPWVWVIEF